MLMRGNHKLPQQSQILGRDFCAEEIGRHFGGTAYGLRRTPEMLLIPGVMPYEYILYAPDAVSTAWTAFSDREDFQVWLDAYGCTLDCESEPGAGIQVYLPSTYAAMQPLRSGTVAAVA